jgi:hypothetical protein
LLSEGWRCGSSGSRPQVQILVLPKKLFNRYICARKRKMIPTVWGTLSKRCSAGLQLKVGCAWSKNSGAKDRMSDNAPNWSRVNVGATHNTCQRQALISLARLTTAYVEFFVLATLT